MVDNAISSYFLENITGYWLVVKRKALPTLPGVSCQNIKNVTKKVLTEEEGCGNITKLSARADANEFL